MKNFRIIALVGLITVIAFSSFAFAATSGTQTVTFSVSGVDAITVSGSPVLTIDASTVTAGSSDTLTASDSTTATYSITTNQSSRKITGAIDSAMPTGTTLSIALAAPTGAASSGTVALSTTAADLVTGISTIASADNAITYTFGATIAAGVISSATRTVTLTVTGE